jgi:hypothetical protein
MKKFTIPFAVLLSFSALNTQAQDWVKMMKDPSYNLNDVEKAYNNWYSVNHTNEDNDKDRLKPGGEASEEEGNVMLFKRWEREELRHADPSGNRPNVATITADYKKFLSTPKPPMSPNYNPSAANWSYAGNTTVPSNGGGAGRVNRVRFMPGNTNTLFACAPVGGLWVSTNGGTSWSTSTDQISDLATSDIAIDPTTTTTMYLATGDGDGYPSIYPTTATVGVLKSTDGGVTWNATGFAYSLSTAGANYYTVNELQINPSNTSILVAATSFGVWYTSDAGTTWTQSVSGDFKSIELEPSHPSIVYAATANALFYKSTDGGKTFTNITSGLPTSATAGRFEIAVTAADSTYVYLLADNVSNYGYVGVYRSTNHGTSFSNMSTSPNLLGWSCTGSDVGGQGWYTLPMAVSPTNKDSLIVGGVNVWMSGDGGSTWSLAAEWTGSCASYVHADIHSILFNPNGAKRIIVGCDGGVFGTTNYTSSWTNLSNNLEIAQQYSIGPSQTVTGRWLTGWQDNGINLSSSPWSQVLGGDGMVTFIDWSNSNTFYAENYEGSLQKSTNAGASWSSITSGITETGPWVTQWCQDPKTSTTLYSGFQNIYRG